MKESIPTTLRSASYYKPKYLPVIISIDIKRHLYRNKTEVSSGLEFNPGGKFTFRLGCSSKRTEFITGDFSSDLLAAISGGVGFQLTRTHLDIGFKNLGAAGYIIGISISKKSIK